LNLAAVAEIRNELPLAAVHVCSRDVLLPQTNRVAVDMAGEQLAASGELRCLGAQRVPQNQRGEDCVLPEIQGDGWIKLIPNLLPDYSGLVISASLCTFVRLYVQFRLSHHPVSLRELLA